MCDPKHPRPLVFEPALAAPRLSWAMGWARAAARSLGQSGLLLGTLALASAAFQGLAQGATAAGYLQEVGNPFMQTGEAQKLGAGGDRPYGGPGDTVQPGGNSSGGGGGGTGAGPSTGSGSETGATGSGPGIPASAGGGQVGGGASGAPTPATPQTPTTGSAVGTPFDWTRWFDLEREALLAELSTPTMGRYGSDGFFLGTGSRDDAPTAGANSANPMATEVVPALLALADGNPSLDVEIELLLALGRAFPVAEAHDQDAIAGHLLAGLKHHQRGHAEVATIALGITGSERFVAVLSQILADSPSGRESVAMGRVPERQRAFAAQSLGFIARATDREDVRRFAVYHLAPHSTASNSLPDLMAAAMLGVAGVPLQRVESLDPAGVAEAPTQSRTAQLRFLLRAFERQADPAALLFAPGALGRLVADLPEDARATFLATAVPAFQDSFGRGRRSSAWERAGAAIALGQMARLGAGPFDRELRDLLLRLADDAEDTVRQLAFLSLGRAAARPGSQATAKDALEGLDEIVDELVQQSRRGASNLRSTSLIALGLIQRGLDRRGLPAPEVVAKALSAGLDRGSDPSLSAAAVVAAGLSALPELGDRLAETYLALPQQGGLRARAAYGVALHQGLKGRALLRAELEAGVNDSATLTALARSLLLMGDSQIPADAAADFERGVSIPRRIGWLDGLALSGGANISAFLVGLAQEDSGQPSVVRARAVRGLGLLCASPNADWARSVARVANLQAPVTTWSDPYLGGVLDLQP